MSIIQILFWLSVSFIMYSYVFYPLILLALYKRPPGNGVRSEDFTPPVSVIVSAYNEEEVIRKRVENLLWLEYPKDKLELIIASDGSTDRTAAIVREYAGRGITLFDYKERRGKVNVLNETVPKAKGEIIVFSDANTFFRADTVTKLVRRFRDRSVGSVCGALYFTAPDGSISAQLEGIYWRYENFLKTVEGQFGALLGANGALYAVRKELFYTCPPDTIIEDFVIPMKILERGFQCVYEKEAIALEDAAKHMVQEKKRRIRIGAGDFQSLGLLWRMLDPRRGLSAFAFWSHKVLRWLAPFFMASAFIANALLLNIPFYRGIFVLQSGFYLLAVVGQALTHMGYPVKVLNLFYYFVSMNLALFLGFLNFVMGTHSVKWERTER